MKRICIICGQEFDAKSSRRSYCYKDHFHPCPICGKEVLTKDTYHLNECCCLEHSRLLADKTIHKRFETWPANSEEAKAKRMATSIERYGTDNPSKNDKIKKRVSEGLLKRYEIDGEEIRARAAQTYFEKTGYYHPMQNPEHVKAVRERIKAKYGIDNTFQVPEFKAKADATNLERYGSTIPMQNKDVWTKQRVHKSTYRGCDGTPLDSTYEVIVYNYCIRNNIPIQRTYPISYEHEGKKHKLFVDFVIDGIPIEVKGEHILDGFFDEQPGFVPMNKRLEIYKENKVILITGCTKARLFSGSSGLKYCKDKLDGLIGIDLELFKNPKFPYKEDRPQCFYDTKVRGNQSCFDAFNDEKLRWQMIKNRIEYVGGFISSKQVVTALNVTRKGQQPSWFSLAFAEKLLRKYSVSDTILDPFAGWGTRHDAAKKLYRNYIGCDLNPKLVEWHKEKGRNIILEDARNFKYNDECDVFTCPPYKDTEIYFEGQDTSISECEWLDIIRQNIPNAKRYIMVCKDITEEYKKYIVETKVNKSHFGTNVEYVLVVENS